MARLSVLATFALTAACGRRMVDAGQSQHASTVTPRPAPSATTTPATRAPASAAAPVAATATATAPAPAPVAAPAPSAPASAAPPAADLDAQLTEPAAESDRRIQFSRAVAAISAALGSPISAETALREMPCGGWSGPGCSNLTIGLEIAKTCAPIIASFHRKRTRDIAVVLAQAISIHSVWHDAYGYVFRKLKKGPGYTYAGCLFSRCQAGDFRDGQIDGILYQVGRLLGVMTGPACGPTCTLAAAK